jgi:hypothetical protein
MAYSLTTAVRESAQKSGRYPFHHYDGDLLRFPRFHSSADLTANNLIRLQVAKDYGDSNKAGQPAVFMEMMRDILPVVGALAVCTDSVWGKWPAAPLATLRLALAVGQEPVEVCGRHVMVPL